MAADLFHSNICTVLYDHFQQKGIKDPLVMYYYFCVYCPQKGLITLRDLRDSEIRVILSVH